MAARPSSPNRVRVDLDGHGHLAENWVPRWALLAIGAMMVTAIAGVAIVRNTGGAPVPAISAEAPAEPEIVRSAVVFRDSPDGAVHVLDAGTGDMRVRIAPETGGFVRGVLRGVARERRQNGLSPAAPMELVLQEDGDFYLFDPASGRVVDLRAFGPTNAAAFAALLPKEDGTR